MKTNKFQAETALFRAASSGHMEMVQFLLEANAKKDLADERKLTPETVARINNYYDVADYIAAQSTSENHNQNNNHNQHYYKNVSEICFTNVFYIIHSQQYLGINKNNLQVSAVNENHLSASHSLANDINFKNDHQNNRSDQDGDASLLQSSAFIHNINGFRNVEETNNKEAFLLRVGI